MNRVRFGSELLVVAILLAATLALTWPLAANLSTAVAGSGDSYANLLILQWDWWALTRRPVRLFDLPIFHPAKQALAFTEHLVGPALVAGPLRTVGFSAVTAYNLTLILAFVVSGYAAYLLGRMVSGSAVAGLVAGLFYAFLPQRFTHVGHIGYEWSGWLPLLLAALLFYDQKPTWKRAVLFGVVFFFNGLTWLHWLVFGSIAIGITALVLIAMRRDDRRVYVLRLLDVTAAALLLLTPFLLPYRQVRRMYGMTRALADLEPFSAQWRDWLTPSLHVRYSGMVNGGSAGPESWLFPGVVPLLLMVLGILISLPRPATRVLRWASGIVDGLILFLAFWSYFEVASVLPFGRQLGSVRVLTGTFAPVWLLVIVLIVRLALTAWRRVPKMPRAVWIALLWIAIGIAGSLGTHFFFHSALFEIVSPIRSIRVPARWAVIAYTGMSMLVALSVAWALRNRARAVRVALAAILAAVMLWEISPTPIRWYISPATVPPVYQWLQANATTGPLLELPMGAEGSDYEAMRWQQTHRLPIVNGVSSFHPPDYAPTVELSRSSPSDLLHRLTDGTFIIVHADLLGEEGAATWAALREGVRSGALQHFGSFPRRDRGDHLFRVHRNPVAAGIPVVMSGIRSSLDSPRPETDLRGRAEFSGRASSPHGLQSITLRFNNGRAVVPIAVNNARAVVFRAGFADRPAFGRDLMDVQVEVRDRSGRVDRTDPVLFQWRDRTRINWLEWEPAALAGLLDRLDYAAPLKKAGRPQSSVDTGEITWRVLQRTGSLSDAQFEQEVQRILFPGSSVPSRRKGTSRREYVRSLIASDLFEKTYVRQ